MSAPLITSLGKSSWRTSSDLGPDPASPGRMFGTSSASPNGSWGLVELLPPKRARTPLQGRSLASSRHLCLPAPLLYWIQHIAVAGCAISGVLAAAGRKVDLFGVMVLAVVTSFGGGTLRDIVLGELPVFWIRDPHYLYTVLLAALFTFFVARRFDFPSAVLQVADAAGLALFTILGARKAVAVLASHSALDVTVIAVAMGVVTGVAGGALRDILMREIPLVFRREIHLYATAAAVGALAFCLLRGLRWDENQAAAVGIALILVLRLAAIRWKLSLPLFRKHDEPEQ